MKKFLRILPLVAVVIWWAYASDVTNVSLEFCNTSANGLTYHIDAGTQTGICYNMTNHSDIPVKVKIWFIDGTYTNDQQQNKACLGDNDREKFWKYVTGYDQLISLKAGESLKKTAQLLYTTGMNWLYHGCIVYSLVEENKETMNGLSIIMRSARFIDVFVGNAEAEAVKAQGTWIILVNFTSADGENISNDPKIRIYQDTSDNSYVVQIKIKNISTIDQEVMITWDISNILSYHDSFVETRKILGGELLVITKKLEKIPPYNLKIKFTINNTPFDFDTPQQTLVAWTIEQDASVWTGKAIGYMIAIGAIIFVGIMLLSAQDKKRRKRKNLHHHIHDTHHHNQHHHQAHKHTNK